jgi:KipI family sensor histidine kinase inhibitor
VTPFGDRAAQFTIPEGTPRRRLFNALSTLPGVVDVVLAEEIGCIVFQDEDSDRSAVLEVLAQQHGPGEDEPGSAHVIRVIYDGEDLDDVARAIRRSKEDVIALHSEAEYRVAMLGFLPGFAYLSGLRSELRLPRRAPRPRVPAGSVAIGADYTGIYPFASPGGWHLLGRSPWFTPFTAGGESRATLAIGDVVRFTPSLEEPSRPAAEPRVEPKPALTAAHLEITRAAGFAILVDGGRPGRMHEGVPPGGPLVRSAFARANRLAGNAPGACAIEVSGTIEVVARGGSIAISDDAGGPITLADGARHVVSTEGRTRARYLAVGGGIEAPVVLGGRGTLLVAGIGRLLRKGDRLAAQAATTAAMPVAVEPLVHAGPIEIMAGPDASGPVLDALTAQDLRIASASDRTGTRLEGDIALPASMMQAMARRSTPMVSGAIELTPSGLIVLGPDHPTTGGYPVVAVVRSSSLDHFSAKPIGATVRFSVS